MYSTQFWIFFGISVFCLLATISCFTATLVDRPSVQQRNAFMSSGIVIFLIIGHLLHFTGSEEDILLLGAKFEYTATICLLAGVYSSLAAFYRTAPNRTLISIARSIPTPFIILITIANNKSSFWAFNLFFKSYSIAKGKKLFANLSLRRGPPSTATWHLQSCTQSLYLEPS